ncbi:T9SS type A sorting domain-containing protein [candidate division KSB1 bacterium]|nr:T9SS type A sorting domain-containing protein [candidate division KSB1 bacterium]
MVKFKITLTVVFLTITALYLDLYSQLTVYSSTKNRQYGAAGPGAENKISPTDAGNRYSQTNTSRISATTHALPKTLLEKLLINSIDFYRIIRNTRGVYSDKLEFNNGAISVCSIASIGMGLVSLCIADSLGYSQDAENNIIETLEAMLGYEKRNGFNPARNMNNGFFCHFIDMNDGHRIWDSEYSSIDTGILVSGALFCKTYFPDNNKIRILADSLYLSIDWISAIADPVTGDLYMTFNESGTGEAKTKPFNEYMIVAWLAKNDFRDDGRAITSWNNSYGNISGLPTKKYDQYTLLTDNPGSFVSSFVIQFPYYLCHYFRKNSDYLFYLESAMSADKRWWRDNTDAPDYIWGLGAGEVPGGGYHADRINDNPNLICSPHIIAGFIPVDTLCYNNLAQLWDNSSGVYELPTTLAPKILWRFRYNNPSQQAVFVQGVDYSTMVFGLAGHPSLLGTAFFDDNTNFEFPKKYINSVEPENDKSKTPGPAVLYQNYPNPFNPETTIPFYIHKTMYAEIYIYNIKGQLIKTLQNGEFSPGFRTFSWDGRDNNGNPCAGGVYIYKLATDNFISCKKLLLLR